MESYWIAVRWLLTSLYNNIPTHSVLDYITKNIDEASSQVGENRIHTVVFLIYGKTLDEIILNMALHKVIYILIVNQKFCLIALEWAHNNCTINTICKSKK